MSQNHNFKSLEAFNQPQEKIAEIDAIELGGILAESIGEQIRNAVDTTSGTVEDQTNVAGPLLESSSIVARYAFSLPSPNKLGSVARLSTLPGVIDHATEGGAGGIPSSDAGYESVALSHSSLISSSIISSEVAEDGTNFLRDIDAALVSAIGAKLDEVVLSEVQAASLQSVSASTDVAGVTVEEVRNLIGFVDSVGGSDYRLLTSQSGSLILKSLFNAHGDSLLGLPVHVSSYFGDGTGEVAAMVVSLKHCAAVGLGGLDLRSVSQGKGLPNASSDSLARVARLRSTYAAIPTASKVVSASLVLA